METDSNHNIIKNNNSNEIIDKNKSRKDKKNQNKYIKFIKTNLYLNDYNYFFKNAIKMNKLREEKYKENKIKTENARKSNILPKMLYFNKFLNNSKKFPNKNPNNTKKVLISNSSSDSKKFLYSPNTECLSSENRPYYYMKMENAINLQNIEENNKSHIKKTIKAFDDLIKCVDNFKLQNKRKKINIKIENNNNDIFKSTDIINNEEISDNYNDDEEEDNLNVENYNFDDYKRQYKIEKLLKNNINSQDQLKTCNSQKTLHNNFSDFQYINTNKIYITSSNYLHKLKNMNNLMKNNSNPQIIKQTKIYNNSADNKNNNNNKINEIQKQERKKLIINNMTLISDDLLLNKIKTTRRNFKKGLYFNEYGKFKFTELGLHYPNSVDKYKKIPDYKGVDVEEKKLFKYKCLITNPKYNYKNIGSFNEKFNNDLSDISTYYGKEYSKGRFLRNPLISMFSKYIPKYEKYKDLKFIENRYISKNNYKYRLKPLINNKKNNFDKLANYVYKKDHKNEYFSSD